jgi:purine-binding chemotaxis protein CheW
MSTSFEEHLVNEQMQVATFKVGNLNFAIDVSVVQEVIKYQYMTPVPLAPPAVRGLINLRGQIITALDMRRILDIEPCDNVQSLLNVIINTGQEVISLMVDRIEDVLSINPDNFEKTPETVLQKYKKLLLGVYKLNPGLLLILDPEPIGSACCL